ncbi:MAG: helix-turn-helix transcriptional regulator [Spirochaetales bacterium]|nr:helix-turn-helix transcriptional regulator [Spirochaetales bacterium]
MEDFHIGPERLALSFIIREKPDDEPYPYVSLLIRLKRDNTCLDLSGFDYLLLETENVTAGNVVVFIKTFEQGVSKPEKSGGLDLRHNEYTLSFTPDVSVYRIHRDDFFTPDWWFDLMNVPGGKRFKETYRKVAALDFQFIQRGTDPPAERKEVFEVKRIQFRKSYPVTYIILNVITMLYGMALVAGIVIKKGIISAKNKHIAPPLKEIPYRKLALGNYADEELARVLAYLEEHYADPRISGSMISGETGIPRVHITELMRNRYGRSCKQIINRIRITEAKRLLKETDRRITEIALEVGFNDISTFNRCFKQAEGMTPRQYRGS